MIKDMKKIGNPSMKGEDYSNSSKIYKSRGKDSKEIG